MPEIVRDIDGREFGFINDLDCRTPVFVYSTQEDIHAFMALPDHISVQVGDVYFTCGFVRKTIGAYLDLETYEDCIKADKNFR